MTIADYLALALFAVTIFSLMAGYPVAFTLAGSALFMAGIGWLLGVFDLSLLGAIPSRIFGVAMWNETLLAVPLFIFMGIMLEKSRVAEELLGAMGRLFGSLRGGLGISVFIVGALLAASTGIVGAAVVTMGLMSLPIMLKKGYDPRLAAGSICAAGTLGQIIPPSIVLIILAEQISNAYLAAQSLKGNWSPEPVSVGDLFAGALIPGLILVGLYISYQILVAFFNPESSPAVLEEDGTAADSSLIPGLLRSLLPPVILIVAVLGSILLGIATPTEAASVGAVGALLLAALREDGPATWLLYTAGGSVVLLLVLANITDLKGIAAEGVGPNSILAFLLLAIVVAGLALALLRLYRGQILREVCQSTMEMTAMVFVILIGATIFSLVFRGLGGDELVYRLLSDLPGGQFGALLVVMGIIFVLGFFLDFVEITFVVVPVVAPVLLLMDISPIWLGIMIALNLQTSFLTPPFGFALFYLRGVAPPEVTTGVIYRGVIPFVFLQLVALGLLAAIPALATWLPHFISGASY
ncbi:TRAP transporter large permease subunit [Sneathiella sp. CAU 1612]|uniref:TRAP transporter large permease subunit n=1 Tax=Sneathiella sedimenti TaxID=2816034 RepID=A0ABS3F7S1_9PROT|nr:TRAP transporter large permease subunit [Sneathiella sedimenti]MBO0334388.1 TRAP transporter large permease subunit [Sneathiella sedimenti]